MLSDSPDFVYMAERIRFQAIGTASRFKEEQEGGLGFWVCGCVCWGASRCVYKSC